MGKKKAAKKKSPAKKKSVAKKSASKKPPAKKPPVMKKLHPAMSSSQPSVKLTHGENSQLEALEPRATL
jgi:hypothetical protein